MQIKIAPSLLAADYSRLADEVKSVERLGVDFLHIDVMDGNFVPNITIGPCVVRDLRAVSKLPFEVHLMIARPRDYIDKFIDAGADILSLHIETISEYGFKQEALKLHKKGKKTCIALNPATKASRIKNILGDCDMVLVMTVNPGFGGQKFIPGVLPKISEIRSKFSGDIAVDGGIDDKAAGLCLRAGANVLASGTYIFKAKNKKLAIERLLRG